MTQMNFGTRPDGKVVEQARISAYGLTISVLTHGATLQDLRLDGVPHPLVLGFATLLPYLAEGRHFGAIVGRCANRIARGEAVVDGQQLTLDRNERERNTLHGGRDGTGHRNWAFSDITAEQITLSDRLPDGHMGFPGMLQVHVCYRLLPGPTLRIEITATSDAPTICNFAQHSYFNLDGAPTIADHRLTVPAKTYLPVDGDLIPLGPTAAVQGTHLDFLKPVRLGDRLGGPLIDHNLCLSDQKHSLPVPAAILTAGGLRMDLASTEPGLQVYAAAHMRSGAAGLSGVAYQPHAGIALESQLWPDAVHQPDYPSAILRPGEQYRQTTDLTFARPAEG